MSDTGVWSNSDKVLHASAFVALSTRAVYSLTLETVGAASFASSRAASKGGSSFFEGTQYSNKVLQQMKGGPGEFHSFPDAVKAFEGSGTVRTVTGGDGIVRQMLEIPGSYQSAGGTWYEGVFQFMKEPNGIINHRLFVPGN